MDDDADLLQLDNVECEVCGERTFRQREGFYYCIECGTQKEQLRAVDLNVEEDFNETAARRTIRKPKDEVKREDSDVTSWEFYNYVLRGFVQELLNMGAKPELKLMTLQVWAAYMAHMEVAFCRDDVLGLPKLNVRALHRDARIIYNHTRTKKRRVKKQNSVLDPDDDMAKKRLWNKTKRKLDASGFVKPTDNADSETVKSIALQWSWSARKTIKRQMPLKHLDKHSRDGQSSMQCHGLRPKVQSLNHFDRNIYCLNLSKLYVVLAIALNMVEEDIQLTDLIRFVNEEHLSSRCLLGYLPERFAAKGKALIKDMEFGNNKDKCSYRMLRTHVGYMSRFINLTPFQTPNLVALTERYVQDLALPPQLAKYVNSLMNLHPPKMKSYPFVYPRFEARVMAYILYAMKLLFGLDDNKEQMISESAAEINECLGKIEGDEAPKLFVFSEWMEFVELRKALVSHYDQSFARRYHVSTQMSGKVDDILTKERREKEQNYGYEELPATAAMQRQYENMTHMVEKLMKEHFGETIQESLDNHNIEFQPSLTPAHSYFQRILLQATQSNGVIKIPACMHVDHSKRDLNPLVLDTEGLANVFTQKGLKLRVEQLPCREDIEEVGLFYPLQHIRTKNREFRANCDIKLEKWIDEVNKKEKRPAFIFRLANASYSGWYKAKKEQKKEMQDNREVTNPFWDIGEKSKFFLMIKEEEIPLDSLCSLQAFNEEHMEPLKVPLALPRRYLGRRSSSETESETKTEVDTSPKKEEEVLLRVSSFDIWLLHGYMSKIRDTDKLELRTLFPHSFRWLLEYCASTIDVTWDVLYEQLLVLEVMFHQSINDWSTHKEVLRIKPDVMNKDMFTLARTFREMW